MDIWNKFILGFLLKMTGKKKSDISGAIKIQSKSGAFYLVSQETIRLVHYTDSGDYICFSWENTDGGMTAAALNIKDISSVTVVFDK